jgi:hypothetical protein
MFHIPESNPITMKPNPIKVILAAFWLAFVPAVPAAIPTVIPYHGRVAVSGAPFTGSGQFRFALTNEDGSQIHWKNSATNQPVAVNVIAGEFEVAVGNAAIPDMADIPFAVFDNSPLYLRVWFNDGANGEHELLPATRLLAVPFAIMAKSVEDGAITTSKIADGAVMPGKIGNEAVGSAQIFPGAVQSTHLGNEAVAGINIVPSAVGTSQLADGSVTAAKLADHAVTTGKIYPEAVGTAQLAPFAVGSGQIVNGAITDQKIANGAVTAHKIPDRSIDNVKLELAAIGTAELADASVTADKLAPNVVQGLINGASPLFGAVQATQLVSGSYHWTSPRTYVHFLHGGEFLPDTLRGENPPGGLSTSQGMKRLAPFALRGDASDASFFRAPLRLPEGAAIRKVSVVLDMVGESGGGAVTLGQAEATFAVRIRSMPMILNQESVPLDTLVDFPLPLYVYRNSAMLWLNPPAAHYIGPAAFAPYTHIFRYDSGLLDAHPITNSERIYLCEIEWTHRANTDTTGLPGVLGQGIYGIRIEYELGELQP